MQLNLTARQVEIIQSALSVVAPSGGGSEIYSVLLAIKDQTGVTENLDLAKTLFDIAIDEYRQATEDEDEPEYSIRRNI